MFDLILQLIGLSLLLGGVSWGYEQWVRPQTHLSLAGRGLLLLVVLTGMGGLIGSPFWWLDKQQSFSWDLPPLAGRMLASAGVSFTVASWLVVQRPSYGRVRLFLWLLATYLVPLVAAIFALHLGRFNFADPITYAFLLIAGGMSVAVVGYLIWQPQLLADEPPALPAPPLVRYWLMAVAPLIILWGIALCATDAGSVAWVWVWPGDWLTSQLIGVMLLALGVGAWYGQKAADTAVVMLAMLTTYGVGIAVASLWHGLVGKPIPISYLIAFSVLALGSAIVYKQSTISPQPK
ncbi:MAG: hypothetical protein OT477_20340 [Chloroflexi bacterium]|nr:hypothetical protein [Chloroflexota bacterium]